MIDPTIDSMVFMEANLQNPYFLHANQRHVR